MSRRRCRRSPGGGEGGPGGALRTVLEMFEDLFVLSGQGTSANMYVELR